MSVLNEYNNKFHQLALFPAAFNDSYLKPESDQTNTALIWSVADSAIYSQTIKDTNLELNFPDLMLRIHKKHNTEELDLLGMGKSGIISWIREALTEFGLHASDYRQTPELNPASEFDNFIAIDSDDEKIILQLTEERNIAQKALEALKKSYPDSSEINVWPLEFNTEMQVYNTVELQNNSTPILLGYAIANQNCNSPHYYAETKTNTGLEYSSLPKIKPGKWIQGNNTTAILPVSEKFDLQTVTDFYKEFINTINT